MSERNQLEAKAAEYFPGYIVRKDLVQQVKGNAVVPTYVLEFLLAQYCAAPMRPRSLRAWNRCARS